MAVKVSAPCFRLYLLHISYLKSQMRNYKKFNFYVAVKTSVLVFWIVLLCGFRGNILTFPENIMTLKL